MAEFYVEQQGWTHWPKVFIMCRKNGRDVTRRRYVPEVETGEGMSITDELREYAKHRMIAVTRDPLIAIANRIDAEYEEAIQQTLMGEGGVPATDENMAEYGLVRLPVDADGEYIHIGDMMVSKDGKVHMVDSLIRNPTWFDYEWSIRLALLNDGVGAGSLVRYRPDTLRHYHAQDRVRKAEAENAKLRETLSDLWELFKENAAIHEYDLSRVDAVRERMQELEVGE